MHSGADNHATLGVVARDYRRAIDDLDIRHSAQRYQDTAARHQPAGAGVAARAQQELANGLDPRIQWTP